VPLRPQVSALPTDFAEALGLGLAGQDDSGRGEPRCRLLAEDDLSLLASTMGHRWKQAGSALAVLLMSTSGALLASHALAHTERAGAVIRFDTSDVTWNLDTGGPSTGEVDLRSIATHEIGHALGFHRHVVDDAACSQEIATMCQYYPGGTFWRTLGYHDIHTVSPSYD
jgi:hypothetical protein